VNELWTVVLAAGEGTRLRPLTRLLHDADLPKQFATIQEGRSLLQSTLDRTAMFCPEERTLVVIARERAQIARAQLASNQEVELVLQPKNLGTGPGILLPLTHVMHRDPGAIVAIVPSDHFISNTGPFVATVRSAAEIAARERKIVLLGAVADRAEKDYGWILPGERRCQGSICIKRFLEKPAPRLAELLLRAGALWNTFVMLAPAHKLREAIRAHMPEQDRAFEAYRRALGSPLAASVLSEIYERIDYADFSRHVLSQMDDLHVVPLPSCGWSDWGTPNRVFQSLNGSPELEGLMNRMGDKESAEQLRDSCVPPMADAALDSAS